MIVEIQFFLFFSGDRAVFVRAVVYMHARRVVGHGDIRVGAVLHRDVMNFCVQRKSLRLFCLLQIVVARLDVQIGCGEAFIVIPDRLLFLCGQLKARFLRAGRIAVERVDCAGKRVEVTFLRQFRVRAELVKADAAAL